MGRHPHHKGHKMPPVVVFIGKQRFKHVKRISKPARQIQVRTVAPVKGWTQVTNELPGHPTTEEVAGSHDPFGWNLPLTPSNWHDTPSKKGVPYVVLFGTRSHLRLWRPPPPGGSLTVQVSLSPAAFTPPRLQTRLGLCQMSRTTVCGLLGRKGGTHPSWINCDNRSIPNWWLAGAPADDPQPPLMCFCNEPLALRVSKISKNPGRLFLGCKSQKCAFFQWTFEPWSQSLRDRWAQVLRHLGP